MRALIKTVEDLKSTGGIVMRILIKSWEDICKTPGFTAHTLENRVTNTTGYQLKQERYNLITELPQPVFAYIVNSYNVVSTAVRIKVGNQAPVLIPIDFIDKILVE